MKTLLRERQLKYIDVEEMRVVKNDQRIAKQIKSDSTLSVQGNLFHSKFENFVMNGPEIGELGKVEKLQILKSIVMNGVRSGRGDLVKSVAMNGGKSAKFAKLQNCENDDETRSQSEERLVKRNHEKHTMLANVEEEQEQDVTCQCKADHECVRESSKAMIGQTCMQGLPH